MLHRLSVGALVVEDDAILLVRYTKPGAYDFWVAPGGGVVPGEDIVAAAAREVREETGIEVEPGRLCCVEQLVGAARCQTKLWFSATKTGGALSIAHPSTATEGIVEARFMARSALSGLMVFPEFLAGGFWQERAAGFPTAHVLPQRRIFIE